MRSSANSKSPPLPINRMNSISMKALQIAGLLFLAPAPGARSQEVRVQDVTGPNNTFHDPVFDVSLTYPTGWTLIGGGRWGKDGSENTFRLRPIWPSEAVPSIYYQSFSATNPRPVEINTWFRDSSGKKEASRRQVIPSYRNVPESLLFKTTSKGLPSFSYFATFELKGKTMAEYFVRVAGQKTYVMLFTQGSFDDLKSLQADIDRMADTIQVP